MRHRQFDEDTTLEDLARNDIIDTRDLAELLKLLEEIEEPNEDQKAVIALIKELEGEIMDFSSGESLIAEHYFKQYAEQYADDIGAINREATWPMNHIDWDEAADDLRQDYSQCDIGDTTFYFRS